MFVVLLRLFIAALLSPAGKGLTSWCSCLWCLIVFLSLSHVVSWVRCGTWLYRFLIFGVFLTAIHFTGQIRALVAPVVKTQRVFSSHGGFLACVKLESPFSKSAEKMLIYMKDSLIYYTQWSHWVWNTGRSSWCNKM